VPEALRDETGAVDVGEQVFVQEQVDRALGPERAGVPGSAFKLLEYSFDAEALIAWKRETERTALNRIGIDAQYAGIDPAEGRADTGVALRIKLIPSEAAGEERGSSWDQELPRVLTGMQMLDALSAEQRGFGRSWTRAEEPPAIDRGASLPEDRTEATGRRSEAVDSRIMSRRTAIEEDHPDWSEERVTEELDLILADIASEARASTSAVGATLFPEPDEKEPDTPESAEPPPEGGGGEGDIET
jgi:hypothetical protein